MTLLVADPVTGLEEVQREAFLILFENVNPLLEAIEDRWAPKDLELAVRTGRPAEPVVLEPVAPENFHLGHTPSLLKAPIERYPNVAAWAVRGTPAGGSERYDHQSVYRDLLYVEVMAKGGTEFDANRRCMRLAEAANIAIQRNRTLNGITGGLDGDPTVVLGEVFLRREQTAYGEQWCWRGARLEYAVRMESTIPSGGISHAASYPGLSIDQG